jgi:uncharacterized protein
LNTTLKTLFIATLIYSCGFAQAQIPQLSMRMTDLTRTLTAEQTAAIEQQLIRFEDTTSNQIVVLMIRTLDGYPIEDFAYETASKNKVGQKNLNNGILFLIVKDDHKARIEVGYGLEGSLPDATASYIIRNDAGPYFKNNDYFAGISAGIGSITKATAGEYKAVPKNKTRGKRSGPVSIVIFIIIMIISMIFRRRRGMFIGPFGGGFGGFGSGSNFGGGGGFSGFSGGGGSFGGGGASGSW